MADHRHHPRQRTQLRIWLTSPRRSVYARIHDVSSGGLGLRVPTAFEPGERVQVTVPLEDGSEIEAPAVVVWVGPGGTSGLGLRFLAGADPRLADFASMLTRLR